MLKSAFSVGWQLIWCSSAPYVCNSLTASAMLLWCSIESLLLRWMRLEVFRSSVPSKTKTQQDGAEASVRDDFWVCVRWPSGAPVVVQCPLDLTCGWKVLNLECRLPLRTVVADSSCILLNASLCFGLYNTLIVWSWDTYCICWDAWAQLIYNPPPVLLWQLFPYHWLSLSSVVITRIVPPVWFYCWMLSWTESTPPYRAETVCWIKAPIYLVSWAFSLTKMLLHS